MKDIEDEEIDNPEEFIEDEDEMAGTREEKRQKMERGELDEDVYSYEGREKELEDDEIEPWEQGFMLGAKGPGQGAKCRKCGKILINMDEVFEKKIEGELCFFCSEKHIEEYEKELKKRKQRK
ncbi:MAG: hypothetical protein N3D84_01755 [Candidatus Woesearchaeota archaeon]|nr:hypothetical protein [Candidatus Woesearchaeota archaeon]